MREELDFKSLRFFSALYRLGNVSPAAEALDISQPTGKKSYASTLTTRCLCALDNAWRQRRARTLSPPPFLLFCNWPIPI